MFGQKYQDKASHCKALEDNAFKGKARKRDISKCKACSIKACKVKACNGKACKDNAVMIIHVKLWNVREMHVWAYMSGKGIIL
jgi:hypothetical protein